MNIDFERVLGRSPNPYVILDSELRIVWANDAYLRVTVREREDIVGRGMFEAFPSEGDSHRQLKSSFERVLETAEPDEIAHIRYDIPNARGGFDTHVWSATHTPFCGEDGNVEYILQHTVEITEMDKLRRMRDATGVLKRAEAVERRYQGVSEEAERLRTLLEQAPGFVAILEGSDHRFVMANAAYRRLIGERDLIGRTVAEALPEVIDQGFVDILDQVYASGRPYFGEREKVMLQAPGSDDLHQRHLEFIFQPIQGTDGVRGVFVQGHDVTEEVAAEEHQRILINELNHRVKNTLAVVQGLAQQSFGRSRSDTSLGDFTARLSSLARAHNLLTERNWEAADLETIVRGSLDATFGMDQSRYSLAGPPVVLKPQAAVALAMVVHELATNAMKYGSLSADDGTVDVAWSTDRKEDKVNLQLVWSERNGPAVAEPDTTGFGSRLIRRGLGGSGDRTTLEFRRSGLHCTIEGSV